ncbi:MAG: glycosyltransferase family 4 protein [Salibacteraceae bacterium]
MPQSIVFFHLLNDFSGSPRVLSQIIQNLNRSEKDVAVYTSAGNGFLSQLTDVEMHQVPYRHSGQKLLTLLLFLWAQVWMFSHVMWHYRHREATFYVNTLLPFGAALAGKLLGLRVVYHLHVTSIRPLALKWLLKKVAEWCADEAIYVSEYLHQTEPLQDVRSQVIYNAFSPEMADKAKLFHYRDTRKDQFEVLMLCSLKDYKGIPEYLQLARSLPEVRFTLVLNASEADASTYFSDKAMPENLHWLPGQKDVVPFYKQADLVLNLSHTDAWVETFGLTLLEAMLFGVPVIGPPVGGPAEFIEDGYNGRSIDSKNHLELKLAVQRLSKRPFLCQFYSENAIETAMRFHPKTQAKAVEALLSTPPSIPHFGTLSKNQTASWLANATKA